MGDLSVIYNNSTLSPTPLVRFSQQFIDYNQRWGQVAQITLDGFITGINGSGAINTLTNIFTGQFGRLTVSEIGGSTLYDWTNVVIDNLSFSNNYFYSGGQVPYSISLKSYTIPSGVIEPINEYSFSQGDDGIVSLSHKISAKGIKNSSSAFNNAVTFVKFFTGANSTSFFIPTGKPVLFNVVEVIDRLSSSFSVTETYKYVTGSTDTYLETFSATINNPVDAIYPTIETNLKIQGSPYNDSAGNLSSSVTGINILSRIQNLGILTGFLGISNFSLNQDSGTNTFEIRSNYISGLTSGDITGYFDYNISVDVDRVVPKNVWKIEGEFFCLGPLDYKLNQLSLFKSQIGNWRTYLSGLIVSSSLFSGIATPGNFLSANLPISIQENSGVGNFKINMSMPEGGDLLGANQKYNVSVQPSLWKFDTLAAGNIEGHYVVQDSQMRNRAKISIDVTADSLNPKTLTSIASGILDRLRDIYVSDGVVINDNLSTGLSDISYNKEWIGMDTQSSGVLYTKLVGSTSRSFTRIPGYSFGY